MLAGFEPRHEWLLEPGDMLYLPPGWGHDGVAVGSCITCSIGFRAPDGKTLAAETLQALADAAQDDAGDASRHKLYRDPGQRATEHPGRIPGAIQRFADAAIDRLLADRRSRRRALGEVLSEPKPGTWFARRSAASIDGGVVLDRRTRMLYDDSHIFVNGESYRASGRDATLMRRLADRRGLDAADVARLGPQARELLARWAESGWCAAEHEQAWRAS